MAKVKLPEGQTSVIYMGTTYIVDDDGNVDVPDDAVEYIKGHEEREKKRAEAHDAAHPSIENPGVVGEDAPQAEKPAGSESSSGSSTSTRSKSTSSG